MTDVHKVFVSYHYDEDDYYREQFEQLFSDVYVSRSVKEGDIDPNNNEDYIYQLIRDNYLRDSTVTVVLIGAHTWQRKFVDWEIYSSLRKTQKSPRSGLLGILLPTYHRPEPMKYSYNNIPPRMSDNVKERPDGSEPYASIYGWPESAASLQRMIDDAFRKRSMNPINSRKMFDKNRTAPTWHD